VRCGFFEGVVGSGYHEWEYKAAADGEIYKLQTEEVAQSLLSLRGSID
jgi:hypothetical protein